MRVSLFTYVAFVSVCVSAVAAVCTYTTEGGTKYDLQFFTDQGQLTTSDSKNQDYEIAVCSTLQNVPCVQAGTSVCQSWKPNGAKYLATGDPTPSTLPSGESDGVRMTFNDGKMTACNKPASAQMDFLCDKSVTGDIAKGQVKFVKEEECKYYFELKHKEACPIGGTNANTGTGTTGSSGSGGKKKSGEGLSFGSIMLIVLLVTSVLYFGVGAAYQYKMKEAEGMDLIIHRDFWFSIPGLAKEGCQFTYGKIMDRAGYNRL